MAHKDDNFAHKNTLKLDGKKKCPDFGNCHFLNSFCKGFSKGIKYKNNLFKYNSTFKNQKYTFLHPGTSCLEKCIGLQCLKSISIFILCQGSLF